MRMRSEYDAFTFQTSKLQVPFIYNRSINYVAGTFDLQSFNELQIAGL